MKRIRASQQGTPRTLEASTPSVQNYVSQIGNSLPNWHQSDCFQKYRTKSLNDKKILGKLSLGGN